MRRRYVLIPLLALIVFFNLPRPSDNIRDRFKVPVNTEEVPDYYMEQLSIRNYDNDGNLQTEIFTPSLSHYEHQGQAQLIKPLIKLYTTDGPSWQIGAEEGRILDSTQDIALNKDVDIRLGKPDQSKLHMTTNQIYYEYAANRVWNQSKVYLDSPLSSGTADGLLIDLKSEQFELHHHVALRFKN